MNHVLHYHVEVRNGRETLCQGLNMLCSSLCGSPTASTRTDTSGLWVPSRTHWWVLMAKMPCEHSASACCHIKNSATNNSLNGTSIEPVFLGKREHLFICLPLHASTSKFLQFFAFPIMYLRFKRRLCVRQRNCCKQSLDLCSAVLSCWSPLVSVVTC